MSRADDIHSTCAKTCPTCTCQSWRKTIEGSDRCWTLQALWEILHTIEDATYSTVDGCIFRLQMRLEPCQLWCQVDGRGRCITTSTCGVYRVSLRHKSVLVMKRGSGCAVNFLTPLQSPTSLQFNRAAGTHADAVSAKPGCEGVVIKQSSWKRTCDLEITCPDSGACASKHLINSITKISYDGICVVLLLYYCVQDWWLHTSRESLSMTTLHGGQSPVQQLMCPNKKQSML